MHTFRQISVYASAFIKRATTELRFQAFSKTLTINRTQKTQNLDNSNLTSTTQNHNCH